jgi:RimJ/RimL family protein N-acetyltransferase
MTLATQGISMTTAPTLETERVLLRPHRPDDLDAYAALWADPIVTRFIGGKPFRREDSWGRILRYAGMWQFVGFGLWVVEDKATGDLIGEAGFHEMKREIVPSFDGAPEAGWVFTPAVHGRGLASEVVGRMHDWANGRPGFERTVCIIAPENSASLAVARKFDYREQARTTYHGDATVLLERTAG